MEHLTKIIKKALIEEYGEDFVTESDNGFYVDLEDSNTGYEVIIEVTT